MPQFVLKDPVITVNSVDLEDWVKKATLKYAATVQDSTTFTGTGAKTNLAGLTDWSIDLEFTQDHDAAAVDATLFALVGAAAFPISIQPIGGTIAAGVPEFSGNAVLGDYTPVDGAPGDVAAATASFTGSGALTRGTGA